MTRIVAYVDTTFEIELDEYGDLLWRTEDAELAKWLADRIQIRAEDVATYWLKDTDAYGNVVGGS